MLGYTDWDVKNENDSFLYLDKLYSLRKIKVNTKSKNNYNTFCRMNKVSNKRDYLQVRNQMKFKSIYKLQNESFKCS